MSEFDFRSSSFIELFREPTVIGKLVDNLVVGISEGVSVISTSWFVSGSMAEFGTIYEHPTNMPNTKHINKIKSILFIFP